ncbi:MAG TPA: prolyl oligopeptidase family serine peptidase [Acidobacteriaceae bacterium]|jgi:dipeptidyl aminopeptidase/acylaminoacyl peptidase|nr:prolyl oligopeptidase family serine peptidase [Acidobacteriaceae bacterium]
MAKFLFRLPTAACTFILIASSVAASPQLAAQSFTIQQVMSAPFPSGLTAASQESEIAWVFNKEGDQNVWVAAGPGLVPHQVTHYQGDNGQPIASLRLTPDGRAVVYARGTELNGAGKSANATHAPIQPKQQVWIADVAGGEPRLLGDMGCPFEGCENIQISPDSKWAIWVGRQELWIAPLSSKSPVTQLTEIQGDMSSEQWSPDGKHIVAIVGRKGHALTVVLDVADGKLQAIHYVAPSVDRDLSPQWSPDGKHIAFLRIHGVEQHRPIIPEYPNPWSLWIADAQAYTAKPIWKSGNAMRDSLPLFGPDQLRFAANDRIVFGSEQDGWDHLYSISGIGGNATLLTPGNFAVMDVTLSADERSVLYSSNQNDLDRRHIWQVDVAGGSPQQALTSGRTIEATPVETGVGNTIACLGSTAITPLLVYKVENGGRELITKDALPADYPSSQFVVPKQVIFKSKDGYTIHGQLFMPRGQTKPGPAVIYTHGGPIRQMMLGFHPMDFYSYSYAENQYLTSLGFTVLSVNYRLGTMYGYAFRNPPNAVWRGASEYNDVLAGAHYLQNLPTVDPHRIGLWGASYGGYLTALALARNSDIFSAGVDQLGVHDWSVFLPEWEEGATSAPDYKAAEKLAWESSPASSVNQWKSPVLVIQGDDDRNVPFSQTVDLVQRLRENHVPFKQIIYPDEIHDFLLWSHFIDTFQATAQFFQQHLAAK